MANDLVSIMMPAYNAEMYIGEALDSVLAQTVSNWELVIIDDGSTDQTPRILAGYADPRIRVFHQPNGGEAAARNAALDQVRGRYLAFLDADDVFLPEHLETALDYFHAHPQCDGLYTDGYYIDQDGRRLKPLSARRRGPFEGDIYEEVMRSSDVFGAPVCVFLSNQVIVQRRLRFDPEIVIGPDWDFLTRYAERACFGYSSNLTCLYRVHTTNISLRTRQDKRRHSLARCREKTIQMSRFGECSLESRSFVFYDLLINLLHEQPERQAEIAQWAGFRALAPAERARLLRLMASGMLAGDKPSQLAGEWLAEAHRSNPADKKAFLLDRLYRLSPRLCRLLLRARVGRQPQGKELSPFADLFSS
jgi:glycosyltransferase involved in cell wall biosynthesis